MEKMIDVTATDLKTGEKVNAKLEIDCCIEHKDKKFCSGGSFISIGLIVGYLVNREINVPKINNLSGKRRINVITTWHGSLISDKVYLLNKRRDETQYLRFAYQGRIYSGCTNGDAQLMRARPTQLKGLYA